MISNLILKSVARLGGILTLVASLGGFFWGPLWTAGVLTGSAWMFVNFYFLFRLLDLGFAATLGAVSAVSPRTRDRILLMSVLKFPVIYLAGFFILKSRFFPLAAILSGITVYFLALIVSWGSFYRGSFRTSHQR